MPTAAMTGEHDKSHDFIEGHREITNAERSKCLSIRPAAQIIVSELPGLRVLPGF